MSGADRARSQRPIEQTVATIAPPATAPSALGSDYSDAEPDVRAYAAVWRQAALVQFATHTDGAYVVLHVVCLDEPPVHRWVAAGGVDPARGVRIGVCGDWPVNAQFDGNPGVMAASGP